ncbi:MAG: YozQ family protein [Vampirovibrio sp.]|nr:YozQ family protein [Vampirovibrio sp.]
MVKMDGYRLPDGLTTKALEKAGVKPTLKAGKGVKVNYKHNNKQDSRVPTRNRPNERIVTVGDKKFNTSTYFTSDGTSSIYKVTHFQQSDGSKSYLYYAQIDPKTGNTIGKANKQTNLKSGRNFGSLKGFQND